MYKPGLKGMATQSDSDATSEATSSCSEEESHLWITAKESKFETFKSYQHVEQFMMVKEDLEALVNSHNYYTSTPIDEFSLICVEYETLVQRLKDEKVSLLEEINES